MNLTAHIIPASPSRLWSGRVLTTLPVLFLIFDSVIKLIRIDPVVDSFTQLGYNPNLSLTIGLIETLCLVLYIVPRTSVLGALLLTGYLGGAVATHLRIGSPIPSHVLFPIYVGALLWAGLFLREDRLLALLPLRK
jgi:hypothetical protein